RDHGPFLGVAMPPFFPPMFGISDAESFKTVMSTTNVPKGFIMRFFELGALPWDLLGSGWLGTGLLTANGPLWKSRRDLLTPSFHFQILQNYMEIFQSRTNILATRLAKIAESDQSADVFP